MKVIVSFESTISRLCLAFQSPLSRPSSINTFCSQQFHSVTFSHSWYWINWLSHSAFPVIASVILFNMCIQRYMTRQSPPLMKGAHYTGQDTDADRTGYCGHIIVQEPHYTGQDIKWWKPLRRERRWEWQSKSEWMREFETGQKNGRRRRDDIRGQLHSERPNRSE